MPKNTQKDEHIDVHHFRIWNSKQEYAFLRFGEKGSAQTKLCEFASSDPILRVLFFLESKIKAQPDYEYPIIMDFPLFLRFDNNFNRLFEEETIKKQIDEFEEKRETAERDLRDASIGATSSYFKILSNDPELANL
jgi:hypothetical protein